MLLASKDHPHGCQLCLCDVGGYPSIGIPTDEKDDPADLRHHDRHAVLQFHKRGPTPRDTLMTVSRCAERVGQLRGCVVLYLELPACP
ncbi:unnamed protein product [Pylaiella littoralis]